MSELGVGDVRKRPGGLYFSFVLITIAYYYCKLRKTFFERPKHLYRSCALQKFLEIPKSIMLLVL